MGSVRHKTPADNTFSPEGAAAWDDEHNITLTATDVGITNATGGLYALTEGEYNNLNSPIAGTYAIINTHPDSEFILTASHNNKLGIYDPPAPGYPYKPLQLPATPNDLMRFLFLVPLDIASYGAISVSGNGKLVYTGSTGTSTLVINTDQAGQLVELQYVTALDYWVCHTYDYLGWVQGKLPWTKIDFAGANVYDLSWVNYAADQVDIDVASSPYSFAHGNQETARFFRYNTVDGNVDISLDMAPGGFRPFTIVNGDNNGAGFNITVAGLTLQPLDVVTFGMDFNGNPHVLWASRPALMGAEPALGNPASDGMVLISTASGARSWITQEQLMPPTYALHYDDTGAGTAYVGEAAPGSLTSDAVWRIKLLTFAGDDVTVTWASATSNFDKTWDSRASYSYS